MSSGSAGIYLLPTFVPDVAARSFSPTRALVRCGKCPAAVELAVVHNVVGGIPDDGRPSLIEQLGALGWAVHESEAGPWAECRYHSAALPAGSTVAAEFDLISFDVIANEIGVRCLACGGTFTVQIQLRPDEIVAAATAHFDVCHGQPLAWSESRLNLAARRPGVLSTFEVVGRVAA